MHAKRSIEDIVDARWSFTAEHAAIIISEVGLSPHIDAEDYPELLEPSADGGAAALAWHLNNTAVDLRWKERRQSMPTAAEVGSRARRIAKLAIQLRSELADSEGVVFDGLGSGALYAFAAIEDGGGGREAVDRLVVDLERLSRWAEALEQRKAREAAKSQARAGRKRDDAFHDLIDRLAATYFHIWRERPGLSRDAETAVPRGPYFRFVRSVVNQLLPRSKTDEAIASTLGNHRWPQWEELHP